MLALPSRPGGNTDEACRVLPNWKREFIEMLGVMLSVSREFRVYPMTLDWSFGQGVGQEDPFRDGMLLLAR